MYTDLSCLAIFLVCYLCQDPGLLWLTTHWETKIKFQNSEKKEEFCKVLTFCKAFIYIYEFSGKSACQYQICRRDHLKSLPQYGEVLKNWSAIQRINALKLEHIKVICIRVNKDFDLFWVKTVFYPNFSIWKFLFQTIDKTHETGQLKHPCFDGCSLCFVRKH